MNVELMRERLLARTRRADEGCWTFLGAASNGYGVLYLGSENGRRRREYAHRASYIVHVGPIPDDVRREIHHVCENPLCVNPKHLQLVTRSEHARLNRPAVRSTCAHGHERSEENVYVDSLGCRHCRVCSREAHQRARRLRGLKSPGWHNSAKTHCPAGHPYDEENTVVTKQGRVCRICRARVLREYRKRRRETQCP